MTKKNISLEEDEIPVEILDSLKVTRDDFFDAMKGITPSALREVFVERPNVRWEDVGGLEGVKSEFYTCKSDKPLTLKEYRNVRARIRGVFFT